MTTANPQMTLSLYRRKNDDDNSPRDHLHIHVVNKPETTPGGNLGKIRKPCKMEHIEKNLGNTQDKHWKHQGHTWEKPGKHLIRKTLETPKITLGKTPWKKETPTNMGNIQEQSRKQNSWQTLREHLGRHVEKTPGKNLGKT